MLRAHRTVTSLVERHEALQEREFLGKVPRVMQFGDLSVESRQAIGAPRLQVTRPREPAEPEAQTGEQQAMPGLHAHTGLLLWRAHPQTA